MAKGMLRIVVALAVIGIGIPALVAMPQYDETHSFYSDSAMQNHVGYIHYGCTQVTYSGTTGDYVDIMLGYHCSNFDLHPSGEYWDFGYSCMDWADNDYDGLVDYQDPGCWSS